MPDLAQAITDYSGAVFLGYFRAGVLAGARAPSVDHSRDIQMLRVHWAISEPVRDFLSYLLSHRHEAQGILRYVRRTDDAVARGRIDTRATLLTQELYGHPSLVVYEEPVRSSNTGPNQVIAWVVHQANVQASRLFAWQVPDSAYRPVVAEVMSQLTAIKRLVALRDVLRSATTSQRPGPGMLRDATRSRRMVYRYAVTAYKVLQAVEAGDGSVIATMLETTLMAPMDQWRRFELAVAAGIGKAIADELGGPLQLSLIDGSPEKPIIRCGRISIYWQRRPLFIPPDLEPSEARLKAALAAYGMELGDDRPDLILVDDLHNRVLAIVEVKYVAGDTPTARFREAMGQIVRYARGYASIESINHLIRRSLIATSTGAQQIKDLTQPAPTSTDFPAILDGSLNAWVRDRLLPDL